MVYRTEGADVPEGQEAADEELYESRPVPGQPRQLPGNVLSPTRRVERTSGILTQYPTNHSERVTDCNNSVRLNLIIIWS